MNPSLIFYMILLGAMSTLVQPKAILLMPYTNWRIGSFGVDGRPSSSEELSSDEWSSDEPYYYPDYYYNYNWETEADDQNEPVMADRRMEPFRASYVPINELRYHRMIWG